MRFNNYLSLCGKPKPMNLPFISDKTFENQDFSQTRLEKGEYENCVFVGCNFSEGYLDNQNFMECEFVQCDLTNANIKYTIFKEIVFKGCKMVGLHFEDCNDLLLSVQLEGCNLTLCSFYGLSLKSTPFHDCILLEVDFTETDLSKAVFSHCNLEKTIFEQTNLSGANLSSSFNLNMDPERNQLRKTRFSKDNLVGLLKKYDIVVE